MKRHEPTSHFHGPCHHVRSASLVISGLAHVTKLLSRRKIWDRSSGMRCEFSREFLDHIQIHKEVLEL